MNNDIKFTFGIITNTDNGIPPYLIDQVCSIRNLKGINKDNYEIILVGDKKVLGSDYYFESHWQDLTIIDYDSKIRKGWITRMKNLITQAAKFNNIAFTHDYFLYLPQWYEGFKAFGDNWDICLNKSINLYVETGRESDRFRDLTLDYWDVGHILTKLGINDKHCLIPYEEYTPLLSPYMYVSGGVWVAKKEFMIKYPLNESLCHSEGEDVEWSRRIRNNTQFQFNPNSTIKINKPSNARIFDPMSIDQMQAFKKYVKII